MAKPTITITITGRLKTGKSIIAQEMALRLEQLGAEVIVKDDSPNIRYVADGNLSVKPLQFSLVEIKVGLL